MLKRLNDLSILLAYTIKPAIKNISIYQVIEGTSRGNIELDTNQLGNKFDFEIDGLDLLYKRGS
jgi:hypothetical protein